MNLSVCKRTHGTGEIPNVRQNVFKKKRSLHTYTQQHRQDHSPGKTQQRRQSRRQSASRGVQGSDHDIGRVWPTSDHEHAASEGHLYHALPPGPHPHVVYEVDYTDASLGKRMIVYYCNKKNKNMPVRPRGLLRVVYLIVNSYFASLLFML